MSKERIDRLKPERSPDGRFVVGGIERDAMIWGSGRSPYPHRGGRIWPQLILSPSVITSGQRKRISSLNAFLVTPARIHHDGREQTLLRISYVVYRPQTLEHAGVIMNELTRNDDGCRKIDKEKLAGLFRPVLEILDFGSQDIIIPDVSPHNYPKAIPGVGLAEPLLRQASCLLSEEAGNS